MTDDLGPKPEPQIEPGEPNPGGADAIDGGDGGDNGDPTIPNLPTEKNPAVDDAFPEEMRQGEDTSTQATQDQEPMRGEEESPA